LWGRDQFTPLDHHAVVPISTLDRFDAIAVGSTTGCGLEGARLFCWGTNYFGALPGYSDGAAVQPYEVFLH
jgi:hypothetical protein